LTCQLENSNKLLEPYSQFHQWFLACHSYGTMPVWLQTIQSQARLCLGNSLVDTSNGYPIHQLEPLHKIQDHQLGYDFDNCPVVSILSHGVPQLAILP